MRALKFIASLLKDTGGFLLYMGIIYILFALGAGWVQQAIERVAQGG